MIVLNLTRMPFMAEFEGVPRTRGLHPGLEKVAPSGAAIMVCNGKMSGLHSNQLCI